MRPLAPLFVPANRPERFAKAAASGADAVIVDLEDAVAPEAKDAARGNLVGVWPGCAVIVRINAAQTPWHDADLRALRGRGLAALMLPKAQGPDDLAQITQIFGPGQPVIALIETAAGLAAARVLARHPMVRQLAFGSVDYCADLGCSHSREALLAARSELVLASRLAGLVPPLDGVTTDLSDPALAGADACHARALGMGGKMCIHPAQITPVRAAFLPGEAEVAWARRVLAAGEDAVAVDGEMVDAPVRRRAEAILAAFRAGQPPRPVQ